MHITRTNLSTISHKYYGGHIVGILLYFHFKMRFNFNEWDGSLFISLQTQSAQILQFKLLKTVKTDLNGLQSKAFRII